MRCQVLDYGCEASQWVRRRRMIVIIGVVALLCIVRLLSPTLYWSGGTWALLDVHVTDSTTGKPLAGAEVLVVNPDGTASSANRRTLTDGRGNASLRVLAGAGGERAWYFNTGSWGAQGYLVEARATNYVTGVAAIGGGKFGHILFIPYGSRRQALTVALSPVAATQPAQIR